MTISSASAGIPVNPSWTEMSPSCMAPLASALSSQCTMIGRRFSAEAVRASRMTPLLVVVSPSSEKPIAPAIASPSKSTASSPRRPWLMVAIG